MRYFFITSCLTMFLVAGSASGATSTAKTKETSTLGNLVHTLETFGANLGFPDTDDPALIAASLIRIALGFVGFIFVLMILYTGVLVLFSAGKEENIERAKKTFFNALIGVAIIFLSYSIVQFIIRSLTEATK